ncbi:flagellar hook protein FlgE [Candidatus Nitrospira allomarina]|uniref:Flagellar hook protein FlgE n=1 Tax=Candidatus Nitrospira allomarina TaxID=3020900 RepID=A0AA96GDH9_9BACT|nr:flagellar hook protein FlgE [Candidatus Nitrospira allomarina]WNM56764.1 flagellar hook protein FlgE [Candidatus Nitrospira allomarina]
MGITSAFFSATSGINATSRALTEIGNNIANAQTIGFKTRTVSFGDLFGANLGLGGASSALVEGRGVRVLGVDPSFTQGSLQTTSNALDLAIDGDGFFQVSDASGNPFFSRAGQFNVDANGYIVSPAGLRLQGYQADAVGNINVGSTGDLVLTTQQQIGSPTVDVSMSGNIDATEPIISPTTAQLLADPSNPSTSQFSTGVRVYDSFGVGHDVTVYFAKTANNTWEYNVIANQSEVTVPPANENVTTGNALVAQGTLTFNSNGLLLTESDPAGHAISFNNGSTAPQTIIFDFGTSITTDGGTGTDGMLQQGAASVLLTLSQDGFANGTLSSTSISEDGLIQGRFSNGTTRNLGQVALTRFINPDGLQPIGKNLFIQSGDSGTPLVGTPGLGSFGKVISSTLEASNVDLGEELVNMIIMQRGFQANSRIITTTNDLLGELVNLAR